MKHVIELKPPMETTSHLKDYVMWLQNSKFVSFILISVQDFTLIRIQISYNLILVGFLDLLKPF